MERPAILVAFVRVLVGQIAEMPAWSRQLVGLTENVPSAAAQNVLVRVTMMLDAPDTKALIISAAAVHDYIHEVAPADGYPCDRWIDLLSSCVLAVQSGFDMPCHSRHAASAASQIWRYKYGLKLFDNFTAAWEKDWARAQLQAAILSLVLLS